MTACRAVFCGGVRLHTTAISLFFFLTFFLPLSFAHSLNISRSPSLSTPSRFLSLPSIFLPLIRQSFVIIRYYFTQSATLPPPPPCITPPHHLFSFCPAPHSSLPTSSFVPAISGSSLAEERSALTARHLRLLTDVPLILLLRNLQREGRRSCHCAVFT